MSRERDEDLLKRALSLIEFFHLQLKLPLIDLVSLAYLSHLRWLLGNVPQIIFLILDRNVVSSANWIIHKQDRGIKNCFPSPSVLLADDFVFTRVILPSSDHCLLKNKKALVFLLPSFARHKFKPKTTSKNEIKISFSLPLCLAFNFNYFRNPYLVISCRVCNIESISKCLQRERKED